MSDADFLIVGGGVAGLSAGARLARHGRVVVIEGEEALGYHASGRSATFSHFGIGNRIVRALTAHSRAFFLDAGEGVLARRSTALFIATEEMRTALDLLGRDMAAFTDSVRTADEAEMLRLFPPLRTGGDAIVAGLVFPDGLRLDSDAMLQAYARDIREAGGEVLTGRRVETIAPSGAGWRVETSGGAWSAPVLIDAAGAWADAVAAQAGLGPIGLKPLRRTIIVVDPPAGADVRDWPFVKTAVDDFYILPESGRLMASPVDEVESDPCDAQPEEYDVALAAWKVERYTTLPVARIAHRWAGLRTFMPPTAARRSASIPGRPDSSGSPARAASASRPRPRSPKRSRRSSPAPAWPESLAALGVTPESLAPRRTVLLDLDT